MAVIGLLVLLCAVTSCMGYQYCGDYYCSVGNCCMRYLKLCCQNDYTQWSTTTTTTSYFWTTSTSSYNNMGQSCGNGYYCTSGTCCRGGRYCCTYFFSSWWFWVVVIVVIVIKLSAIGCCIHRRRKNAAYLAAQRPIPANTGVLTVTGNRSEAFALESSMAVSQPTSIPLQPPPSYTDVEKPKAEKV